MSIGVSLGWNCATTSYAVNNNIRNTKKDGYNTCVFDLMLTNYPGIVQCIEDDFKFFLDLNYIEIRRFYLDIPGYPIQDELLIYNSKYKFWFNHESPGHANLYIKEKWENGTNHYIMNNYEKFIERYKVRINNFRNYLNSGNPVKFILNRYKTTTTDDIVLLNNTIKHRYPNLDYSFELIWLNDPNITQHHLINMGFNKDDDEVKRLN
jgi:hypothetical protein